MFFNFTFLAKKLLIFSTIRLSNLNLYFIPNKKLIILNYFNTLYAIWVTGDDGELFSHMKNVWGKSSV